MSISVDQAYGFCRDVARNRAKNFYYAFLALPSQQRKAIYAAYAFCRQCDDYSDEPLPLEQKRRLLDEYRQKLDRAYAGDVQELMFTALMDTTSKFNIPKAYFDEVINGVEMDLTIARYQTFDDLREYCYRVASVVGLICVEIFGYSDPKARDYAVDLGIAMQLTNILRDLKEDSHRNRIYIPLDELARFGYTENFLYRGVINDNFREMMQFQVSRARDYFGKGRKLLPLLRLRPRLCPSVLQCLYQELLNRIESRQYDVFNGRVRLSTSEKLALTGRVCVKTLLDGLPRSR